MERELHLLKATQNDFITMLNQVAKHMQTLVKYLREIVAKTEDPVTIEHT